MIPENIDRYIESRTKDSMEFIIKEYLPIFKHVIGDPDLQIKFKWVEHCNTEAYGFTGRIFVTCKDGNEERFYYIKGRLSSMPGFCGACVVHDCVKYNYDYDGVEKSKIIWDVFYSFMFDVAYVDKYRCVILTDQDSTFESHIKYRPLHDILKHVHSFLNARSTYNVSIKLIELDKRGLCFEKIYKKYMPITNDPIVVDMINKI